jgi:uncharacterized protein
MIDADVHCAPESIDALSPYLDDYWRDYVANAGMRLNPTLTGAYPPAAGPPAPGDPETLASQLLDPAAVRGAILNCVSSFDVSRNVYYEAALTRAVNDWLKAEWLDRDDRLRASLVVPTLDTDAAVEEIDRLGGDERFVQVLLPVRNETPWGNKRFHRIYEAAARHDLVIGLHAWGRPAGAPTSSGFTHSYLEDYLGNSQIVAQGQVLSLVSEGVFERVPALKVCLVECGFSWLPFLLWRFDKDWKAVWREVPWVKEPPSAYVRRHIRATTAPAHIPRDPGQLADLLELLGAGETLLYSSDFPHQHGDGVERLLDALDDDAREAVLHGNAEALYGQALPRSTRALP